VTDAETFEFHTKLVGKLASFGEEFQTYVGNLVAFKFTIYKYAIHIVLSF
jgi:hypothetical protein